jgi:hypothetical protein
MFCYLFSLCEFQKYCDLLGLKKCSEVELKKISEDFNKVLSSSDILEVRMKQNYLLRDEYYIAYRDNNKQFRVVKW